MFIFCDVLHKAKQKRKQTLESAQCGLEIIFKAFPVTYILEVYCSQFLVAGCIL